MLEFLYDIVDDGLYFIPICPSRYHNIEALYGKWPGVHFGKWHLQTSHGIDTANRTNSQKVSIHDYNGYLFLAKKSLK